MTIETDFPDSVAQRPEVARVIIRPAAAERRFRIIHLCNLHMIPRDVFSAMLRADGVGDPEIRRRFEEHERQVERVQREQHSLMLYLVNELHLTAVHLEGLCPEDTGPFLDRLRQLRAMGMSDPSVSPPPEIADRIREDRLLAGTAGRLSMEGRIRVRPVENRRMFEAANPLNAAHNYADNPALSELRESGIVQTLIHDGAVSFVILGGLHDLSDNIPEDCEYVRIETREYARLMDPLSKRPDIRP